MKLYVRVTIIYFSLRTQIRLTYDATMLRCYDARYGSSMWHNGCDTIASGSVRQCSCSSYSRDNLYFSSFSAAIVIREINRSRFHNFQTPLFERRSNSTYYVSSEHRATLRASAAYLSRPHSSTVQITRIVFLLLSRFSISS